MNRQTEIKNLLERYISGTLDDKDHQRLTLLINQRHLQPEFESAIEELLSTELITSSEVDKHLIFKSILEEAELRQRSRGLSFGRGGMRVLVRYTLYAAACLLLIAGGIYLLWIDNRKDDGKKLAVNQPVAEKSNTKKATLTLANGSTIVLDDLSKEDVARIQDGKVTKADENKLVYSEATSSPSDTLSYNVLTVPRGQQYQLQLPDGTKVWLNSATSLRFPVRFGAAARKVELEGEAYFDVAKDPQKGFVVSTRKMEVNVLGTQFNIMAYEDEQEIRTTLVEGSVKLKNSSEAVVIQPGQQGVLNSKNVHFVVQPANTDVALAWKNGDFNFQNTDIQTIMRQIARWYDVSVEYAGPIPEVGLSGIISRKEKVSQLLEILQAAGKVSFRQEQDKILVQSQIVK